MYALLETRQRRSRKRWVIGLSAVCILAVTVICIVASKSSYYKKTFADKYIKMYNKSDADYASKYASKYANLSGSKNEIYVTGNNPVLAYFDKEDAADVTWAHAVNSKAKLNDAMADDDIMMLEADVILDPVGKIPIMAHPPANSSNLTLEVFIMTILNDTREEKKGIKLDFKETQAIEPSIEILKKALKGVEDPPPVLLNADILKGPNTDKNATVDPKVFLNFTSTVKDSMLSPGWTTGFNGTDSVGYSLDDVNSMAKLLRGLGVREQFVTFPIRASLAVLSEGPLEMLLGEFEMKGSLTIWTSKTDTYKPEDLAFLRKHKKKVFYDLPSAEIEAIKKAGYKSESSFDWKKYVPKFPGSKP